MYTKLCTDNNYCVYMHISPSGKKYIGITSTEPNKRWRNGYGYKNNQYFYRAIEKYGWDNFQHIIIARGLTKDEAEWLEVELIRVNDSANHSYGYNIDLGGNSIGKLSEEHKQKISESKIGEKNPNYGKCFSEETRQRMSAARKGVNLTEEHKQKLSESKVGKNNPKAKAVICITTNQVFYTAREAERVLSVSHSSIAQCCKGKLKSAGKLDNKKLVWKYIDIIEL